MRAFTTRPAAARRRSATGLLYLVISGLLWGTGGLTGSLLGRTAGLSAISVAAFRLTAGGLLIVVFLTVSGRRWPAGRAAWSRITAIGLLAALFQSCYFTAVALTSVPLATLVTIGAAPVIVLGVDRVTGRRTGRFAVATTGLAVTGLGLLVGLPSGFRETAVLASAGLAVLAAAGFAAVTLAGSRPVPGLDDLTVTGFSFTIGGLALMPLAQMAGGISFRPGLAAIGLLVALGTGPTAVAYTLYFRGLRSAPASTGALLSLLEPLTGAILAAFLLGERLSATGIAGAAIIATAVILTVRANRSTQPGARLGLGCRAPVTAPERKTARAEHRLSGLDGDFGDAADVTTVLDGRGDQFAQAAEQHDHELAWWRRDASGTQFRGVGEVLDEHDEGLKPLALQVAGIGAERREVPDPAQRDGQIGLRHRDPGLDGLPHLGVPWRAPVDRGRDLAHHRRVGLLQQGDETGLLTREVLVERAARGARMAHHVGDRGVAETVFANGRGHAFEQPRAKLRRGCHGLRRPLAPAVVNAVNLSLPAIQACTLWYSGVPSIWYACVPLTGGARMDTVTRPDARLPTNCPTGGGLPS